MKKINLTNNKIICITPVKHIKGAYETLQECGTVYYESSISADELKKTLIDEKINCIFTNPNKQRFKIDKAILSQTAVEIVCTASTGLSHIDIDYCNKNEIKIISLTCDYDIITKITSTAEMSFALMMALIRNIPRSVESVRNYEWDYEQFIGRQLNTLTVGIIGYGRLGKIFAGFCQPFFKKILITDPFKEIKEYTKVKINELLAKSDIIALHVHLNKETYHMINKESISKMKDNACLINTSRGSIVDEQAVIEMLNEGKLLGYATDVIEDELKEDISKSCLIREMKKGKNIIITPHIGGMTKEAQEIAYLHAIQKMKKQLIIPDSHYEKVCPQLYL